MRETQKAQIISTKLRQIACMDAGKEREHKHMDVRRYASMDGGGRAVSGTKAESNAGAVAEERKLCSASEMLSGPGVYLPVPLSGCGLSRRSL